MKKYQKEKYQIVSFFNWGNKRGQTKKMFLGYAS